MGLRKTSKGRSSAIEHSPSKRKVGGSIPPVPAKFKTRSSVGSERQHPALEVAGSNPAGSTNMTAAELKEVGPRLYGYGWQTRLAEALDVEGSTVRRWVSGAIKVPGPAAAAIRCFAREKP